MASFINVLGEPVANELTNRLVMQAIKTGLIGWHNNTVEDFFSHPDFHERQHSLIITLIMMIELGWRSWNSDSNRKVFHRVIV